MALTFDDLGLDDPTDALRAEVARLRTVVARMEQSRSWQVTRPLRALAKWTRLYQLERYRERARKKSLVIAQTPAERASLVVNPNKVGAPNVCGVAHIYYPDLATEIVDAFLRCGVLSSVIITTPSPDDPEIIEATRRLIATRPDLALEIVEVENLGRDIYPFLQVLNHPFLARCDVFLKIHTKKSLHLDEYKGHHWRRQLLQTLAPDPQTTSHIAFALHHGNDVFLACPEKFAAGRESWGRNRSQTTALAKSLGLPAPKDLVFAAGSMFWAKSELLAPLAKLNSQELDFSHNSAQLDGSLPHAFERLFGIICTSNSSPIWLIS